MKLIVRLLTAGTLGFLMIGLSLIPAPVVFAADKRLVAEDRKEQTYVASRDGDKYHTGSCRVAGKIKPENKVVYPTKAEAEKAGKKPCGICKP